MTTQTETVQANVPLPQVVEADEAWAQAIGEYKLVERLIKDYPRDLGDLQGVPIKLLFKQKPAKFICQASAFPKKQRFIHPYIFLITINRHWWEANPEHHDPAMFEALYSCDLDPETGAASIRKPEVETYLPVVQHFGCWQQSLKDLSGQLDLFERNSLPGS